MAKSALVLLDADVVIEIFRLGIWDHLVNKTSIYIAATVAEESDHYFDPVTQQKHSIDLMAEAEAGRITILDGNIDEIKKVDKTCREHLIDLDAGELESIAVTIDGHYRFCTADKAAVLAMAVLDLREQSISLEELLRRHGVTSRVRMNNHYSGATMAQWLKEGGVLRVQSFGKKR